MEIRKAVPEDTDEIKRIFASAKKYMAALGNTTQWGDGYPGEDIIKTDIANNNQYIITEQGKTVGVFSLIIGEDSTYRIIKDGKWHHDKMYGTIHRLASDGTAKGIANACFKYCAAQIDYLRIDTHKDNLPMQATIEKFGFRKCGIIYVRNGSERIAFDYSK